jgi:tetratricopeptide (TPR) repeat protein
MRRRSCEDCRKDVPLRELLEVRRRVLCVPCAELYSKQPGVKLEKSEVQRLVDPTMCTVCDKDFGAQELERLGSVPVCDACALGLRKRPFPRWLRAAMAGLLVLLGLSLVRGAGYFKAEAALVRAEQLMGRGSYTEASAQLQSALEEAPNCRRCVLLKIKADILGDNLPKAMEGVKRAESMQFEGELIQEVNRLLKRVDLAFGEMNQAQKLMEEGKESEAWSHVKRARQTFPESKLIRVADLQFEGGAAFDKKDYVAFLRGAEETVRLAPDDPQSYGVLASALAARYASTGDTAFQARAVEALDHARQLCKTDQQKKDFEEYRERIEYRLKTKDIIDKKEYDRRFRGQQP